jgi:hypothetical protein
MTRLNDPAAVQRALVDSELTAAEVAELWSFLHGDIMESGIRVQLRAGLGLCPRHTWGYAVTEIELWQTGAGPRGGHQPFDVSVLYEDLLDHVAARLRRRAGPFRRDFRHVLIPRQRCPICSMINRGDLSGRDTVPIGYAGAAADDLARETNQLAYTKAWCRETWPTWQFAVCAQCAAALSATTQADAAAASLCRLHLLDRPVTSDGAHVVAAELEVIAGRLGRLNRSMTKDGPPAGEKDDASWVEALGWFAGWHVPLALAAVS